MHGNTASSKMYAQIAEKYQNEYRVILIDFLGHGRSDRLEAFPCDLWFYEEQQVIAFLREKCYSDVNIIASSGGAMVAINVALEVPELVDKVIVDSFQGEVTHRSFTENLLSDRDKAKSDPDARAFYAHMHGDDWGRIVDCDTAAIIKHEKEIKNSYHKPLRRLKADILLTGSREDEFMNAVSDCYLEHVYQDMIGKIGHGRMHMFDSGGHPAMITNHDGFYKISRDFFM